MKWIDINDRLPDDYETKLIWSRYYDEYGHEQFYYGLGHYNREYGFWVGIGYKEKVLYWVELSSPPSTK